MVHFSQSSFDLEGVFIKFAFMPKKIFNILFVFMLVPTFLVQGCKRKPSEEVQEVVQASMPPEGFRTDSLDLMVERVREGEAFTSLMTRLGMSQDDAMALAL